MMHVSIIQGGQLPDNQAYLYGCSTVTALRNNKFLSKIWWVEVGIEIDCNTSAVVTNKKGKFGWLGVWYLSNSIANFFFMQKLKKTYRITYDSWEGFSMVHTQRGEVHFHKDEQELPYTDLVESCHEAAWMLLHYAEAPTMGDDEVIEVRSTFVQMVQGNYKGKTKFGVLLVKEAHCGQAMLGNPSKKGLLQNGERHYD